jgi:hypothetical protein
MIPSTADRVRRQTADSVNARIYREMRDRVAHVASQGSAAINRRLAELDREWDIERALEANAAGVTLAGVALGTAVDRRFFAIPALVGTFLLMHAVQGWCPPLPVLRRLGFRTAEEIHRERMALKALRGDFRELDTGSPAGAMRYDRAIQAAGR